MMKGFALGRQTARPAAVAAEATCERSLRGLATVRRPRLDYRAASTGRLIEQTTMSRIPFTVSARAARLIGRENVATAQGAVTELVKNTYDADARVCAILFVASDPRTPQAVSEREFAQLAAVLPAAGDFYPKADDGRKLKPSISEADKTALARAFSMIPELWIVDNGHGMAARTIADRWMVIGTDTKEVAGVSAGGRVMTGAKGIGRFALDRLGQESELYSAQDGPSVLAHWMVDWGEFEGRGKVISDVEALLEEEVGTLAAVYAKRNLTGILPKRIPDRDGIQGKEIGFDRGTAIRISALHDLWDQRDTLRLKSTLEALLPPRDRGDFDIFVYDFRAEADSGFIDNFPPDQFDYWMYAEVDAKGAVVVELARQEIDVPKISPTVFTLPAMDVDGYRKSDLELGRYRYTTSLRSVLKLKEKEPLDDYLAVGPLNFTLYFFKLSNPTADTLTRFPQKSFDAKKRRDWLKASGGVRLYRDEFRVRPYGEPNSQGSDWLLLGQRAAGNPAGVARAGWRVPPQQLAGTIHITKDGNPLLADQSNREGIMNERAFAAFRGIILGLIGEFEHDRALIFSQFDKAFDLDNPEVVDRAEGLDLADRILDGEPAPTPGETKTPVTGGDASSVSETVTLARTVRGLAREKTELEENAQVLMGMATLGTVLVSFTHELKQIKANMSSRRQRMTNALNRVVDKGRLAQVSEHVDPYKIVDRWAREDEKVSRWVDFALSAVSPSKRRKVPIRMETYFAGLEDYWQDFLSSKSASMTIGGQLNDTAILAHEIDLDSVFYNLIVNSVEAFTRPSEHSAREIRIESVVDEGVITVDYADTGPGLSTILKPGDDIFAFGVSTKASDDTGQTTGTGIGMWIVRTIVQDWGGEVVLGSEIGQPGFNLRITVPAHVSSGETA